ncbi:MAG: Xaa-Pro peptidase family protein [Gemmatimonadetes bacterium]|nr:Xaa-Pro peptidase family protein [Gemmatimonadota bacterium]
MRLALSVLGLGGALSPLAAQKDVAFPPGVYAERRARLRAQVPGDPIVLTGDYLIRSSGGKQHLDFWYMTGVESPYAILVMTHGEDGQARDVLFVPEEYQFTGAQYPIDDPRFRRAAWNRSFRLLSPGAAAVTRTGVHEVVPIVEFARRLADLTAGARRVWFLRDGSTPYVPPGLDAARTYRQQLEASILKLLPAVQVADVSPLVNRMRLVKDEHEIRALRRAAGISALGLVEAMRLTRPGLNDLEVAGFMEYIWKREGSPRPSFATIVMSGAPAVSLYTIRAERYHSTDRIMQDGELLYIDYGAAEYDTYASDVCRTFPVSGRFTPEQRRYYDIVVEAMDSALAHVRPGVMMIDVIRAAARVFRQHGLEQYENIDAMGEDRVWGIMPSPTYWLARNGRLTDYSGARGTGVRDLGHHVGLDALDSRDYTIPLAPGMVFTVEPKLYIPERGIAIMVEDMILVTGSGYENLSAGVPKRADEIERLMMEARAAR